MLCRHIMYADHTQVYSSCRLLVTFVSVQSVSVHMCMCICVLVTWVLWHFIVVYIYFYAWTLKSTLLLTLHWVCGITWAVVLFCPVITLSMFHCLYIICL